jgi:hypothetical protein
MFPDRGHGKGRQLWPRAADLQYPLLDWHRFGARAWVQTVRCEPVDDPLDAEGDRGQHFIQAGQLGPDDVIPAW